jgi:GxxExxY protein
MEVHRELGPGFLEAVYKDALAYQFEGKQYAICQREGVQNTVQTNRSGTSFYADFIIYGNILVEAKATSMTVNSFIQQTLNYLKASD